MINIISNPPQEGYRTTKFILLLDTPSVYSPGKFLRYRYDGIIYDVPYLTEVMGSAVQPGDTIIGSSFKPFALNTIIPYEGINSLVFLKAQDGSVLWVPMTFEDLLEVVQSYQGYGGYYIVVNADKWLTFLQPPETTFLYLKDTPSQYIARYALQVQNGQLVFSAPSNLFTGLADTPEAYEDGKFLKSTASSIVFSDISFSNDLVDVTDSGQGFARSTASGVETVPITLANDLTDVTNLTEGEYLYCTSTGITTTPISGLALSFLDLTDTPSAYDPGKLLLCTSSGLQWTDHQGCTAPVVASDTLVESVSITELCGNGTVIAGNEGGNLWVHNVSDVVRSVSNVDSAGNYVVYIKQSNAYRWTIDTSTWTVTAEDQITSSGDVVDVSVDDQGNVVTLHSDDTICWNGDTANPLMSGGGFITGTLQVVHGRNGSLVCCSSSSGFIYLFFTYLGMYKVWEFEKAHVSWYGGDTFFFLVQRWSKVYPVLYHAPSDMFTLQFFGYPATPSICSGSPSCCLIDSYMHKVCIRNDTALLSPGLDVGYSIIEGKANIDNILLNTGTEVRKVTLT